MQLIPRDSFSQSLDSFGEAMSDLEVLEKLVCEDSLIDFAEMSWQHVVDEPFVRCPHLELQCRHLEAVSRSPRYSPRRDEDDSIARLLINMPPSLGKALCVDTPVLTTWGWKKHGEIVPGDFVFGPDGQPRRVLAVTSHMAKESSVVQFSGDWIGERGLVAANDHLWRVERTVGGGGNSRKEKQSGRKDVRVVPTSDLRASKRHKADRIPVAMPIELPPKRLLIDPYVLGMWLGDGTSETGCISVCDEDLHNVLPYGVLSRTDEPEGTRRRQRFHRVRIPGLSAKLRVLLLLGDKHVPADYLESSVEQRMSLLQGLMDTDGCCGKDGTCEFSNNNTRIIAAMRVLLASLGIKSSCAERYTTLNGKRYGPSYRVVFRCPEDMRVFRLERKQERTKAADIRSKNWYLSSVKPAGVRTVNCIQVEGEIYLAGHDMIPTHNSTILSVIWPAWVWTWWPSARFLFFSYSEKIIKRDSLLCRQLVHSDWYQRNWGEKTAPGNKNQILDFNNLSGGWRLSLLVNQGTGHHPDFLATDDPQGREGAKSPTDRERIKKWFFETTPSRGKIRRAAHIVQQQRFDEDDLSGEIRNFITANQGKRVSDQWHTIMLPMHFDPSRAMADRGFGGDWRTVAGELLAPQLIDETAAEDLALECTQTDANGAMAQLEQNPKKVSGDMFKIARLKKLRASELPPMERVVRFWDRAATADGGCFTAGVLMGIAGGNVFVIHVCRGQWSVSDVYTNMQSCAVMDTMRFGLEKYEIKIEREQGSGGKESAENAVVMLAGYNVEVIFPWTNKEGRAVPLANRINIVGDVYYVEDTPNDKWNDPWLDELRRFPDGKFKDQVDASSGAYTSLCGTLVPKRTALVSGMSNVDRGCRNPHCDGRPAADGSDFCCSCCEMTAEFNDPSMKVDHPQECNFRASKFFNQR